MGLGSGHLPRPEQSREFAAQHFGRFKAFSVYHIDPNNHTGYAQVLEEKRDLYGGGIGKNDPGDINKTYTLGHDVIAQTIAADATSLPTGLNSGDVMFFLYDGHGSTRALMKAVAGSAPIITGQVFAYDAFGNRLDGNAALTSLLYSGEQTDRTGLQYLRARYYNPANGRFNRLDPFAGKESDPLSLHKYLYTSGDPVTGIDPSGLFSLAGSLASINIGSSLRSPGVDFDLSLNAQTAGTALRLSQPTNECEPYLTRFYPSALASCVEDGGTNAEEPTSTTCAWRPLATVV